MKYDFNSTNLKATEMQLEPSQKKRRRLVVPQTKAKMDNVTERQVSDYLISLETQNFEGITPLQFWHDNRERYNRLHQLAMQILSIPATSAPVERLFSAAGLVASGRRTTIGPTLIEAEVLLRINARFLDYTP